MEAVHVCAGVAEGGGPAHWLLVGGFVSLFVLEVFGRGAVANAALLVLGRMR